MDVSERVDPALVARLDEPFDVFVHCWPPETLLELESDSEHALMA